MEPDRRRPKPTRRTRTKAQRAQLLAELRASGKSVRSFALERGLPISTMYEWVRAQGVANAKATPKTRPSPDHPRRVKTLSAPTPTFTEVSVVDRRPVPAAPSTALTVALRCGHVVTFEGSHVDLAWLRSVLEVVNAC